MYTCTNCGSTVTPAYARVFGNNRNQVDHCVNCFDVLEAKEMAEA